jgi:predicted chitinase
VRTRHLQLVTSTPSDTTTHRSNVRQHFGPVSPGSTTLLAQETLRANQLAQLSELLNSLESVVESLNYKSFTLYDTWNTAIEAVSAALNDTQIESGGTKC